MNKGNLTDQIIEEFMTAIGQHDTFPKKLHEDIRKLSDQGKLTKGSHLKDLLMNFDVDKENNETV